MSSSGRKGGGGGGGLYPNYSRKGAIVMEQRPEAAGSKKQQNAAAAAEENEQEQSRAIAMEEQQQSPVVSTKAAEDVEQQQRAEEEAENEAASLFLEKIMTHVAPTTAVTMASLPTAAPAATDTATLATASTANPTPVSTFNPSYSILSTPATAGVSSGGTEVNPLPPAPRMQLSSTEFYGVDGDNSFANSIFRDGNSTTDNNDAEEKKQIFRAHLVNTALNALTRLKNELDADNAAGAAADAGSLFYPPQSAYSPHNFESEPQRVSISARGPRVGTSGNNGNWIQRALYPRQSRTTTSPPPPQQRNTAIATAYTNSSQQREKTELDHGPFHTIDSGNGAELLGMEGDGNAGDDYRATATARNDLFVVGRRQHKAPMGPGGIFSSTYGGTDNDGDEPM